MIQSIVVIAILLGVIFFTFQHGIHLFKQSKSGGGCSSGCGGCMADCQLRNLQNQEVGTNIVK